METKLYTPLRLTVPFWKFSKFFHMKCWRPNSDLAPKLESKAWFPYDRKESQGIAASRNKSGQVCLRLSAIIWKPAKTLFATPCDSLRSLSQAVHCDSLRSIAINGNHCSQLLQLLAITTLLLRGIIPFP